MFITTKTHWFVSSAITHDSQSGFQLEKWKVRKDKICALLKWGGGGSGEGGVCSPLICLLRSFLVHFFNWLVCYVLLSSC